MATTFLNQNKETFTARTIIPTDKDAFKTLKENPDVMKLYGEAMKTPDVNTLWSLFISRAKKNSPLAPLALVSSDGTVCGFVFSGPSSTKENGIVELSCMIKPEYQNKGLATIIFRMFIEQIAPEIRRLGLEGDENFRCYPPIETIPSEQRILREIFVTAHHANFRSLKVIQYILGENHSSTSHDPKRIAFRATIKTTQSKL